MNIPSSSSTSSNENKPRDAENWAHSVSSLQLGAVPSEAMNLTLQEKQAMGPLQGFARMWQKTS